MKARAIVTLVEDRVIVRPLHWTGYPKGWMVALRVERTVGKHELGASAWMNPAEARKVARQLAAAATRIEEKRGQIAKTGPKELKDWERRRERGQR